MYLVRFCGVPAGRIQTVIVRNSDSIESALEKVRTYYPVYAFIQIKKIAPDTDVGGR